MLVATLLNPPEGVPAQHKAVQFGIVAQNRLTVARAAHVEFKSMGAVPQSKVKGCQSVFRRVMARAAMSEK